MHDIMELKRVGEVVLDLNVNTQVGYRDSREEWYLFEFLM